MRTADYLYVKNFATDRWPSGDPYGVTDDSEPSYEELCKDTYAAFPDIDMSPTKAWLVHHRKDDGMKKFIDFAWGKRPEEELYDLRVDPHQTNNLASDPKQAETLKLLRAQLMQELRKCGDPRLDGDAFDRLPYRVMDQKK